MNMDALLATLATPRPTEDDLVKNSEGAVLGINWEKIAAEIADEKEPMIEPTWANVQTGDTIQLARDADKQTAEIVVATTSRTLRGCGAESTVRGLHAPQGYHESAGWNIVSITRPEPVPGLPTEPGCYWDPNTAEIVYVLDELGTWYFGAERRGREEMLRNADVNELVRLEPVPVTAKTIIDEVEAWQFGPRIGPREEATALIERLRKEFEVTL